MNCPNCGKEIPAESAFCLSCGAAIPTSSWPEKGEELSEPGAIGKPAWPGEIKWAWVIGGAAVVAIIVIFALASYSAPVTPDRLTSTQLYNKELGVGLKLGMSKSQIDGLLAVPDRVDDAYCYRDTGLYAHYYGGKLAAMYVSYPNQSWHTTGGIVVGSSSDDLTAVIGQPDSVQYNDTWWYYFHGDQVAGFEINSYNNKITSIYIYNSNWANNQQ